jgi:hypothetical protein
MAFPLEQVMARRYHRQVAAYFPPSIHKII